MPDDWETINFEDMHLHLNRILEAQSLPKNERSATAQKYLNIYEEEKYRFERMERMANDL